MGAAAGARIEGCSRREHGGAGTIRAGSRPREKGSEEDVVPGIRVGGRLPKLRLPRAGTGGDAVRPVLVALHDPGCDACRAYLGTLARERSRFDPWDGTVYALADVDAAGLQEELGDAVAVLVDADRAVLDRLGGTAGPVTVVADRYGQVFHIEAADRAAGDGAAAGHPLLEPRELEEWLKYLATQCPE